MNYCKQFFIIIYIILCTTNHSTAIRIDRVIVATDAHPGYMEFWPIVARAWKHLIGIKPTLALVADKSVTVDESLGDVIRFKPIEGIATGQQAQVIRLLLPAYFEDEVCITSDIDMLPISKEYFIDLVKDIPNDNFIVYRDTAYGKDYPQYPICYVAGKGKLFKEIFNIRDVKDIPAIIKRWHKLNLGWATDEKVLYTSLQKWPGFAKRCVKFGHVDIHRIDRSDWTYSDKLLKTNHYTDSHMLRPYRKYKKEIDRLICLLDIPQK
jgi:hypothetical protein